MVLGLAMTNSIIGVQGCYDNILHFSNLYGQLALLGPFASFMSFIVCKQSAGFSGASDATRVSILLGLLKVHVNTFATLI